MASRWTVRDARPRWWRSVAMASLLVVGLAGCGESGSTDTAARTTASDGSASTVVAPQNVALAADVTTAAVGTSFTVHGTGCLDPSGDGTPGRVEVGIGVGFTGDPNVRTFHGIVKADGSFTSTVQVDDLTPPGDQQIDAICFGPERTDLETAPRSTNSSDQFEFFLQPPPVPITITGAHPLDVSPIEINRGGTIRVRAQCQEPGSNYEALAVWITAEGNTTPVLPGVPADVVHVYGTHCTAPKAVADVALPADMAPGRYVVRAGTAAERTPRIRWFQPVEITVTP